MQKDLAELNDHIQFQQSLLKLMAQGVSPKNGEKPKPAASENEYSKLLVEVNRRMKPRN